MNYEKLLKKFLVSGIWTMPLTYLVITKVFPNTMLSILVPTSKGICWLMSIIPLMIYWIEIMSHPKAENGLSGKEAAMRPPVNSGMLFSSPEGVVFGKWKGKYVCKKLKEDGHIFLIGGSGTGKSSSLVIPTILANDNMTTFAIDIKGELSFKSTLYGSEKVRIFNPLDRKQWGYDPLYCLNANSSQQEVLVTMQNIAYSLIPLPADVRDPFWKTSSRNLLTGLLVYHYNHTSKEFVSIIDEILSAPIDETVSLALSKSKKSSLEYKYLVQFETMAEETMGGIVAEMNNHLTIFSNDQDIRFAFKHNSKKINPLDLESGYSIYLVIKEEKLTAYYDVLQLIINQTLMSLEKRPEDSEQILFVIDELPRILSAGKIERLLDASRTLRSRKVSLFLITQSTEALMSAYTENEVADLISNCVYKVILSASSQKTAKQVCDWCGTYTQRRQSWSSSGMMQSSTTTSYEERPIVEPADLMQLVKTGEAILISPYGYNRISKGPYYKDKYLAPIAEQIVKANKKYIEEKTYEKKET